MELHTEAAQIRCAPHVEGVETNLYKKMNAADVSRMLEEGRLHLQFMASVYKYQVKNGRHFLHEHPASAISWKEQCIQDLLQDRRVGLVTCDQCQFGLTTKGATKDIRAPAMKPTKFMSSSSQMLSQLDRRCDRSHTHQHLSGGRCAEAAFYPIPLIKEMLRGIRATHDAENVAVENHSDKLQYLSTCMNDKVELCNAIGGSQDEPNSEAVAHTFVSRYGKNGGKLKIEFEDDQFKKKYVDEYTGEILQDNLIREAIVEELSYFCEKRSLDGRGLQQDERIARARVGEIEMGTLQQR